MEQMWYSIRKAGGSGLKKHWEMKSGDGKYRMFMCSLKVRGGGRKKQIEQRTMCGLKNLIGRAEKMTHWLKVITELCSGGTYLKS